MKMIEAVEMIRNLAEENGKLQAKNEMQAVMLKDRSGALKERPAQSTTKNPNQLPMLAPAQIAALRDFVSVYMKRSAISFDRAQIESIKFVRCMTGWGLKEAKDFVDTIV